MLSSRLLNSFATPQRPCSYKAISSFRASRISTVSVKAVSEDGEKFTSLGKGANKEKLTNADALTKSLEELSNAQGRRSLTNNMILGTDNSMEKWRELDEQVNEYPAPREFKAIGTGGKEFVAAMVAAVEKVVGSVHSECVQERPSAKGKYVSVTVGPVWVKDAEQVIAIYANMREDSRLKWYI